MKIFDKARSLAQSLAQSLARSPISAPLSRRAISCTDLARRGDSHLREGRLDDSLKCYRKAALIDPERAEIRRSEGLVLGMMGRYMEAIAALDLATKIDPEDPRTWMFRGFNFWRLERWRDALFCFERALVLDPEDGYARHCRDLTMEAIAGRDKPTSKCSVGSNCGGA